jgi:hypothetical protein
VENECIKFEALLHLSVFVMMRDREEGITSTIKNNSNNIKALLEDYFPQKNQDDFIQLRKAMKKRLEDM